mmetsp:Transcript_34657/g.81237  ORF Transcript_34657/g.81237 Transcript_34657/m.81237 type:complete len:413 (+) Transcript_34657:56-1294(+)
MKFWESIGAFYGAKDPSYAWPLALVHLNITLYALTFWLTRPVMPFLTTQLGADAVVFGYLQTVFSFVQLLGAPIIGRLCDTQGAKIALQMCQLATGLSYILLGSAWNIPVLFASQLPTVLMQSMHCSQAFVTDFSSDESRSSALGRLSLSYAVGMALGPMLGGLLSDVIGYHGVAWLAGALMFVPFLANMYSLPAHRPGMEKAKGEGEKGGLQVAECLKVLKIPTCRNLTVFMLMTGLAGQIYHSTFSMAGPSFFKLTAKDLGMFQTMSGVIGLISNTFVVGALEKALSQRSIITLGASILVCTFTAYSFATSFEHLLVIGFVSAFPSMAMYTTVTSMVTRGTPREVSATVIGLGHAARSLCGIVAPTIGGYLYKDQGVPGVGFTCAAIMVAAAVWSQVSQVTVPSAKSKEL